MRRMIENQASVSCGDVISGGITPTTVKLWS
jgi:hypothetical protein